MLEISAIISTAINFVQIFLTFWMIACLLKIKVNWQIILAYSAVIAPMSSDDQWIMLAIFVGSSFVFYILTTKMQLKLTLLAITMHLFSSLFISSVIQFSVLGIMYFVEMNLVFIRILSVLTYMVLLGIIRYRKINFANLLHNKMIFTLSTLMLLISMAIYAQTPLEGEAILADTNLSNSLWRTVIQFVVAYMIFALSKFATEVERHETHRLYTDTLEESLDNLSSFKHDSRNMIQTLQGYCELENYDKVKSYLNEISGDIQRDINIATVNARLKDNMPYLYGIVLAKAALAATSRIHFNIRVTAKTFELKTVSEVQLSRMIGNLLNNAFDAAKQAEYKEVNFTVSNVLDNRIKIEIINTVRFPVDTARLLEKGYSTKEGHSGLGLYQIQSIVEHQRREGFNVKFELYNSPRNTFTAELLI